MNNERYAGMPMKMLFDNFVLSIIGKLPQEKEQQLNSMNLAKVFKTEPNDWKNIVKQVLQLSDTIEIAVLDLWYKNQELATEKKIEYHPDQFAMDFVDNYLKEDSRIDIWTDESLTNAKERIKQNQKKQY